MADLWFLIHKEKRQGPFSREVLVQHLFEFRSPHEIRIWHRRMAEWTPAAQVAAIAGELPPPIPTPPRRVALVSCVSRKLESEAQAKDLYVSPWFRLARQWVEKNDLPWWILSAKHGLVHPNSILEPYDDVLSRSPRQDRKRWASRVLADLVPALGVGTEVVLLAGKHYRVDLVPALDAHGMFVQVPMEGLGIGQQLAWLKS